jgi:hypothetical protein
MFRLNDGVLKPTGSKVKCSKCGEIFKVFRPSAVERRKNPRVKTQNLISYFSFNETGKMISHGLGIAMDVSKGGLLLETMNPIKPGLIVLAATDRERNLIEVQGKIAYSKKISTGTYATGIEFTGVNARVNKFITKLIKEYSWQGYNLFYRWHNSDRTAKDAIHPPTNR